MDAGGEGGAIGSSCECEGGGFGRKIATPQSSQARASAEVDSIGCLTFRSLWLSEVQRWDVR